MAGDLDPELEPMYHSIAVEEAAVPEGGAEIREQRGWRRWLRSPKARRVAAVIVCAPFAVTPGLSLVLAWLLVMKEAVGQATWLAAEEAWKPLDAPEVPWEMKGRLDEVCERAVARVGGRAPRLGVVGGEQTCALTPLSSWGRGLVLVGLDDFEGLCDGELEAVLVHEIGHVRARDGWRDEALFGGHLAVYIVAGVGAAAGVIGPVVLAGVALGCWTSHFVTQRALSRRREAAADRFAARAGVGVALAGALWARGREDGVPGADGKGLTRWFARLRMSHPLASERRSYLVRSGVNWPETDPASG